MRRGIIAGVICLSMALAVTGCSGSSEPAQTIEKTESESVVEFGFEEVKKEVSLQVQGSTVNMEIAYPQVVGIGDQLTEERVNKTIRQAFKSEHALLAGEGNVVDYAYEVVHFSKDWISIKFDFVTDPSGDGENTYQLFTTFTVDMHTGEPILFHNRWTALEDKDKEAFIKLVETSLSEGQAHPIAETFPEAYFTDENFMIYYYEDEMKTLSIPLQPALDIFFKQ